MELAEAVQLGVAVSSHVSDGVYRMGVGKFEFRWREEGKAYPAVVCNAY